MSETASRSVETSSGGRTSYLGRCLGLLQLVAAGPEDGLSLSELAQRASMPVSTASRLAQLLEERGFARRLDSRRFVPGPALLALGFRSLRCLPAERYLATVERLAVATGESVSVGLVIGDEIVLVARHEPPHTLRAVAKVGDVIPPDRSAMGKAVLSHVDQPRSAALLAAAGLDPAALAPDLLGELELAYRDGFARDEEQFTVGLRCIAAPLLGEDGEAIGAVSIAGPAARFSRDLADSFLPNLLESTRQLSDPAEAEAVL